MAGSPDKDHPGAIISLTRRILLPFSIKGFNGGGRELGKLGEIKDILETGANDVYVIESPEHGEILIPAIKEVILAWIWNIIGCRSGFCRDLFPISRKRAGKIDENRCINPVPPNLCFYF